MQYSDIISFWFEELTPEDWFKGGAALDTLITERFLGPHQSVAANEHWHWRENAHGALAEIIVLDQFSRNLFRGKAEAFAFDGHALALAQVAIVRGFEGSLSADERQFLYMPFMHSESKVVHEQAVTLFTKLGREESLKYELSHKAIIDRFGRYPHRNNQLGRSSTEAELRYLSESSEAFFNS